MMMAMLGLAVGCGYTLAMGEMVGLYVALSLVLAVAVLFDFRTGAVLLILMLPFSASSLFPHGMLGITGLNPLNLLLMATIGSYLVFGRLQRAGALVPRPLLLLYIPPIILAGLIGMQHVYQIPSFFYEFGLTFFTERQYLITTTVKPLVMVAAALMIGAAIARSERPERFIVAIAVSAWIVALIQLSFALSQGLPIAAMASPGLRSFYSPIGIHANDLGRLHLYAAALLLFVWAEARRPGWRLFLVITLAVLMLALVLTFSRASIAGAALVGALFLLWKFNARSLAFAIIGLLVVFALVGDALLARLTLGMDEGADAVSAGRIEGIWLPLLPELLKSPVWGNGQSSVLWSFPMLNGIMAPVGHAHNAYLEAALDMGFVGLGLMLAYFAHVWRGFHALGANERVSHELRGLFQGASAALAAFLFTGLVGSSLTPSAESAFLWIAIGLMYGVLARRPAS
jgi:O-antigen ligase